MRQMPSNVRPLLIALVALAVGLPAAIAISGPHQKVGGVGLDQQIRTLLEQRLQLVERVVREVESKHASGTIPFETVLDARKARDRAELDLCTDAAERVKVYEKMVANAKQLEGLITSRVATGTASTTAALRAKVKRIEAEVALLRAKRN